MILLIINSSCGFSGIQNNFKNRISSLSIFRDCVVRIFSSDLCVCIISICNRFKLKNIEETEAAKKLLQEKRFVGRSKSEFSIPSSYSADYFHRGRDYAEKLRRGASSLYIILPFGMILLFYLLRM